MVGHSKVVTDAYDFMYYFGVRVGAPRGQVSPHAASGRCSPYQSADSALARTIPPEAVNVFEWILSESEWVRQNYLGKPKAQPVYLGRKM
jgi:hypothetical protein